RFVSAPKQLTRIMGCEERHSGAIHQLIVGAVVYQQNPIFCDNWRWPRLDHSRIEFAYTLREHGLHSRLSPMNKITRICKPGLVGSVSTRSKEIHPVSAAKFLRNDRARLCPLHVPIAFIRRQNNS